MRRRTLLRTVASSVPALASGTATADPSTARASTGDSAARDTAADASIDDGPDRAPPGYEPLGSVSVPGATEAVVGPDASTAYVAATDGFAVVDVTDPASPTVVETRTDLLADRDGGPLTEILDVKVDGDRLLVAGPANAHDEPSLEGVLLYDVSDPQTPERVAFHETEFPIHNAHLDGDHAYLVNSSQLVVVDVSGTPTEVGRWRPSDADPAWRDVNPLLRFAHDVYVQDDRAYVVEWDAGTFVLDVSDPANPTAVTRIGGRSPETLADVPEDEVVYHSLSMPGNHHTAMVNDDGSLLVLNKEAWPTKLTDDAGVDPLGEVELWDVTDETTPRRVATIEAPDSRNPEKAEINTTPHNFDIAGDRLYSSWYDGGVKVHDVSDPATPELLAWWRAPTRWSFWTAQLATDEFFVASSHTRGEYNDGKGALVTFPNSAGEQRSPPPLAGTRSPGSTVDTQPSSTSRSSAPPSTPASGTTPVEPGTTVFESDPEGSASDTDADATPGFGVFASATALALGAWRWRSSD